MATLLVDNYDSYTFNLYQLIASVRGEEPIVVQNDDFESDWEKLCSVLVPGVDFTCVVISPGPGSPTVAKDVGLSEGAIRDGRVPVLGVCLGHQLLGFCEGATVRRADEPMHGRLSSVYHEDPQFSRESTDMFYRIPSPFNVVRYHSLVVEPKNLPDSLEVTAKTKCETIMALRLKSNTRLAWGVQFHPESISSEYGKQLMENFFAASAKFSSSQQRGVSALRAAVSLEKSMECGKAESSCTDQGVIIRVKEVLDFTSLRGCPTEIVFKRLFVNPETDIGKKGRFWLDSASSQGVHTTSSSDPAEPCSQFSYMGDGFGPMSQLVEAFVNPDERTFQKSSCNIPPATAIRLSRWNSRSNDWEVVDEILSHEVDEFADVKKTADIFKFLDSEMCKLKRHAKFYSVVKGEANEAKPLKEWSLPFQFCGGYVGYFGYGLRRLCGVKSTGVSSVSDRPSNPYRRRFRSRSRASTITSVDFLENDSNATAAQFTTTETENTPNRRHKAQPRFGDLYVPDSSFLFVDRFLAWEHSSNRCFVVTLSKTDNKDFVREQEDWARGVEQELILLAKELVSRENGQDEKKVDPPRTVSSEIITPLEPNIDDDGYKEMIEHCIELIRCGETYEVCLTKQLSKSVRPDIRENAFGVYSHLRSSNPAPYAALLEIRSPSCQKSSRHADFAICCSSPERFMKVDRNGNIESKPIKGTIRRGLNPEEDRQLAEELRTSMKDRAENLMIVDLVRNDIGRVCEIGSVHVPKLMCIETFASVHQLVTTVQGKLKDGESSLHAVRSAFPGGSMTGAPKLRTMQIIDEIEKEERGVYSGGLGFLSICGAVDLNIVIRTAVVTPEGVSVGTGGAIVVLSDAQGEVDETTLKAAKLQNTFAKFL